MVESEEKVSILVPIYGVEKYIERCAVSLFEQTYRNIEYIFVNDCSKDYSLEVLEQVLHKYPQRRNQVKVINHEVNRGLAAARNTACENMTGRYFIHVDSDDALETNAVETLYNLASKNNSDLVVFGHKKCFPDGHTIVASRENIPVDKIDYLKNILYRDCGITMWGKFISSKVYIENGIKAVEGINYGEDYVTLPKVVYYSKNILNCSDLSLYRFTQVNTSSYTGQKFNESHLNSILSAVKNLEDFLNEIAKITPRAKTFITPMKIRNKIFLIERTPDTLKHQVEKLYTEVDNITFELPVKHRIVWWLYRKKLTSILKLLVYLHK